MKRPFIMTLFIIILLYVYGGTSVFAANNQTSYENGYYVTEKTYLGLRVESGGLNFANGKNMGCEILEAARNGIAYNSGIRAGDVLMEVNGNRVKSGNKVTKLWNEVNYGETVEFKLIRRGSEYTAEIEKTTAIGGIGVKIGKTAADQVGIGVSVKSVDPDSPGERAGIQKGDLIVGIDLKPVLRPNDVEKIINNCKPGEFVNLEYIRDDIKFTTEVELDVASLKVSGIDKIKDITIKSGEINPIFTIKAKGDLDIDTSFNWYRMHEYRDMALGIGISEEYDPGLRIENEYDEEKKIYTSTLWANGITRENNGEYGVFVTDRNTLRIDSPEFTITVY